MIIMVGGVIVLLSIIVLLYGLINYNPKLPLFTILYILISLLITSYNYYNDGKMFGIIMFFCILFGCLLGLSYLIFTNDTLEDVSENFFDGEVSQQRKNVSYVIVYTFITLMMLGSFL